jgi:hypothetical protein
LVWTSCVLCSYLEGCQWMWWHSHDWRFCTLVSCLREDISVTYMAIRSVLWMSMDDWGFITSSGWGFTVYHWI